LEAILKIFTVVVVIALIGLVGVVLTVSAQPETSASAASAKPGAVTLDLPGPGETWNWEFETYKRGDDSGTRRSVVEFSFDQDGEVESGSQRMYDGSGRLILETVSEDGSSGSVNDFESGDTYAVPEKPAGVEAGTNSLVQTLEDAGFVKTEVTTYRGVEVQGYDLVRSPQSILDGINESRASRDKALASIDDVKRAYSAVNLDSVLIREEYLVDSDTGTRTIAKYNFGVDSAGNETLLESFETTVLAKIAN
jgi:hypothetical protein